jgi:hypothetical protein
LFRIAFIRFDRERRELPLILPVFKDKKEALALMSRFGVRMVTNRRKEPDSEWFPRLLGKRANILAFLLALREFRFEAPGRWGPRLAATNYCRNDANREDAGSRL